MFAAQFCYIVSEADWGTLTSPTAELVLLLSSATGAANIEAFATTEAIQCTEIYEFVQRLGNKDYHMPFLQVQNQCSNHCIHTLSLLIAALQISSPAAAAVGRPEHLGPGGAGLPMRDRGPHGGPGDRAGLSHQHPAPHPLPHAPKEANPPDVFQAPHVPE